MKLRDGFVSNSSSSSFQLRSTREYLTAPQVVLKYPLKNDKWIEMIPLSVLTDGQAMKFAAPWPEYPKMDGWPPLDPWNREFIYEPEMIKGMFTDDSGVEVGCWKFRTSVDGFPVECHLLFGEIPTILKI